MPNEYKSSSIICSNCGSDHSFRWVFRDGSWFCSQCAGPSNIDYEWYDPGQPKAFMKNDKAWRKDILNRKLLPNGKVARFKKGKGGEIKRYG